ncbi:MAG: bifunctional diguanylate cyclase/phosphodiesterase [Bacillota bacterium]|nr:bifunctional diguanylate cyclase/phosphodiesterase [Bacillota bacterium]
MRRSLKGFLFFGAIIGSLLMFIFVYIVLSNGYEKYIEAQAITRADNMAVVTFNSINQLMRKGLDRNELEQYLSSNQQYYLELHSNVRFYGREAVVREEVGQIFSTGEADWFRNGSVISYIYPSKITESCLSCHKSAQVGEVLGIIEVRQNIEPLIAQGKQQTYIYLLFIFPLPILGAYLVSSYLSKKINRSINELHNRIAKINKMDDLKLIEMNNIDLTFNELNVLYKEIKNLASKMKIISVDKDILEFEVKLLQKFIITSEVVKDWKEHVNYLLVEINKIMEAHLLFSIFKVEDEDYILEVFWLQQPTVRTQEVFETVIKEQLKTSALYKGDIIGLVINHNIALAKGNLSELDQDSIAIQTKSLFLDTPRIGGIVGIGVNSSLGNDTTRVLVVESVLTTLLNVIGSVKAIYKYTKELEYFATRDPLTNLYTQRVFWELLSYEVKRAERHDYKFSVLVIDLDDFKLVNDLHGHLFGDKFLQEVAIAIRDTLRKEDILSRYGGDEYAVILPYSDQEQAHFVASRIMERLRENILTSPEGKQAKVSASIGIAVYPDHGIDSKNLFLVADNMMYKAKGLGKQQVGLPTHEDVAEIFRTIKDKNTLILKALEENKVFPHFQPIIDNQSGAVIAHEVLMRIDLPEEIMVASDFVETAESMGIINKLDFMLMEKAFAKVKEENYSNYIFLNLSPKALILNEFMPTVRRFLKKYEIEPSQIVFEITERDTVKNMTTLEKFVLDLKLDGFKFAIDDFGSGFSSFQYVKRLPIDFVKIEGDFIRSIVKDGAMDRAIVMSIATLAREIGIVTIAEFVEDEEILARVKALGINYSQGYYVGRPSAKLILK